MRPRGLVRGFGQFSSSLPDISQLPATGDLNAQLAHGQALLTNAQAAISSGNTNAIAALLSQGVTMASGQTSSTVGTLVRDVVQIGAATAIGATGGPFGAVAGALASSIELALQSIFGAPQHQVYYCPDEGTGCGQPSTAAQRLYQLQQQWSQLAQHVGAETGYPLGWTFYDYISRKYPISEIDGKNKSDLWTEVVNNLQWTLGYSENQIIDVYFKGIIQSGNSTDIIGPYNGQGPDSIGGGYGPGKTWQTKLANPDQKYANFASPLCTPIFWLWAQPSEIQDCGNNEFFGSGGTDEQRYVLWQNDTVPIVSNGQMLSAAQIMAYAEANRPSSMFFASDLYVTQVSGTSQIFTNLEAMCGLTSWLGILAAGGGIQSVAQELFFQQKLIYDELGFVPSLFRKLVEHALGRATAERIAVGAAAAAAASTDLSTADKIGLGLLGAVGMAAVGLLGYSAYTKQSPVVVTRDAVNRTGRLFR